MGINDLIYKEIDDAIEEINKSIDKLLNGLEPNKNLEQFLKEYKKEECENLTLDDQLVNFVKFVEDKEMERINVFCDELTKSLENAAKTARVIQKKFDDIDSIKKEKPSIFKRWLNTSYHKKLEDFKILEFKKNRFFAIIGNGMVNLPNKAEVKSQKINISDLKTCIKNYNEIYNLDQIVKENPLFMKYRKNDLDSPQSMIKYKLSSFQKELKKIREDSNLNLSKKSELLVSRMTDNKLLESVMSYTFKYSYKPISAIIEAAKGVNPDTLINAAVILGVYCQITAGLDEFKSRIPAKPVEVFNIVKSIDSPEVVKKVMDFYQNGNTDSKQLMSELNLNNKYPIFEVKPINVQQNIFPNKKLDVDIDY